MSAAKHVVGDGEYSVSLTDLTVCELLTTGGASRFEDCIGVLAVVCAYRRERAGEALDDVPIGLALDG